MPSVRKLEAAIAACATERQALHERGAGRAELEHNRLELARLERSLARAWIELHLR